MREKISSALYNELENNWERERYAEVYSLEET
jgi:hypothetical protein